MALLRGQYSFPLNLWMEHLVRQRIMEWKTSGWNRIKTAKQLILKWGGIREESIFNFKTFWKKNKYLSFSLWVSYHHFNKLSWNAWLKTTEASYPGVKEVRFDYWSPWAKTALGRAMCLQAALLPFMGVQGPWLMGSSRNVSWSPTSWLLLWSCHACLLWWLKAHCMVQDPFPILRTRPNHSPCLPCQLKGYIRTETSWGLLLCPPQE